MPKDEQASVSPAAAAAATSSAATPSNSRKIFVGGLASTVEEKTLREYFIQWGSIEDAVVMYDHHNRRPRGFGFITFEGEESIDKLFGSGVLHLLHDKQVRGRRGRAGLAALRSHACLLQVLRCPQHIRTVKCGGFSHDSSCASTQWTSCCPLPSLLPCLLSAFTAAGSWTAAGPPFEQLPPHPSNSRCLRIVRRWRSSPRYHGTTCRPRSGSRCGLPRPAPGRPSCNLRPTPVAGGWQAAPPVQCNAVVAAAQSKLK